MNLKDIIIELQKIQKELDLGLSDSNLFEQAVKIYISKSISKDKRKNIEDMQVMRNISNPVKQAKSDEPKPQKQAIKPASNRQLLYLSKLGYKGNMNLNSSQASLLIKSYTEGGKS